MKRADKARATTNKTSLQHAYDELQYYTLSRGDPGFIHQHVVDAWAVQHADEHTKPIGLAFALIGLYLRIERGFSGRQVQKVHMKLAQCKRSIEEFIEKYNAQRLHQSLKEYDTPLEAYLQMKMAVA